MFVELLTTTTHRRTMAENFAWFALRVAPHTVRPVVHWTAAEFGCEWGLNRAGITTSWIPYALKPHKIHRNGKRSVDLRYPVLSTYVFVRTHSLDDLWNRLWHVPIVKTIIGVGGAPRPISQEAINILRAKITGRKSIQSVGTHQPHKLAEPGDVGTLNQGAFAGHPVKIEEIDDDTRTASVLLWMFGSPQRSRVPLDHIDVE